MNRAFYYYSVERNKEVIMRIVEYDQPVGKTNSNIQLEVYNIDGSLLYASNLDNNKVIKKNGLPIISCWLDCVGANWQKAFDKMTGDRRRLASGCILLGRCSIFC